MGTVPVRFIRHINAGLTDICASIKTLQICVDCPHFSHDDVILPTESESSKHNEV